METLKTAQEIAPALRLTTARLYELARSNFFPAGVVVKFRRQVRFNEQKLVQFLENGAPAQQADEEGGIK